MGRNFRITALILSIYLSLFTGRIACASDQLVLTKQFQTLYANLKSAMANYDSNAISALLAPEFVSVDVDGNTTDADQMIEEISASPKDPNKKSETTVLSVKIESDIAHVEQKYHMTTTKLGSDGTNQQRELTAVSMDDWKHIEQGWYLLRTETTAMDYLIDGKLVVHKTKAE
jgi:ketosteroid isomerase-like protein